KSCAGVPPWPPSQQFVPSLLGRPRRAPPLHALVTILLENDHRPDRRGLTKLALQVFEQRFVPLARQCLLARQHELHLFLLEHLNSSSPLGVIGARIVPQSSAGRAVSIRKK